MILVDTSVWVDHFRTGDPMLAALLESGEVLSHPFVVGELALGGPRQRDLIVDSLSDLPRATVANDDEVMRLITIHSLSGQGVGYVDVHLLAAASLSANARLWTRDKRLASVAAAMALSFDPRH